MPSIDDTRGIEKPPITQLGAVDNTPEVENPYLLGAIPYSRYERIHFGADDQRIADLNDWVANRCQCKQGFPNPAPRFGWLEYHGPTLEDAIYNTKMMLSKAWEDHIGHERYIYWRDADRFWGVRNDDGTYSVRATLAMIGYYENPVHEKLCGYYNERRLHEHVFGLHPYPTEGDQLRKREPDPQEPYYLNMQIDQDTNQVLSTRMVKPGQSNVCITVTLTREEFEDFGHANWQDYVLARLQEAGIPVNDESDLEHGRWWWKRVKFVDDLVQFGWHSHHDVNFKPPQDTLAKMLSEAYPGFLTVESDRGDVQALIGWCQEMFDCRYGDGEKDADVGHGTRLKYQWYEFHGSTLASACETFQHYIEGMFLRPFEGFPTRPRLYWGAVIHRMTGIQHHDQSWSIRARVLFTTPDPEGHLR